MKRQKAKNPSEMISEGFRIVKIQFSRGGGIRTPGTRKGSTVFKTAAFDRSATPL